MQFQSAQHQQQSSDASRNQLSACTNTTMALGPTYLTINDTAAIFTLISRINQAINSYYTLFPTSDQESVSFLDKVQNSVIFFSKISQIVSTIVDDKERLIDNVDLLTAKVQSFQSDLNGMIRFYGYEQQYLVIKLKTAPYEQIDAKFNGYWSYIRQITTSFNMDVQQIMNAITQVGIATRSLYQAIKELDIISKRSRVLFSLDDLDNVLGILAQAFTLKITFQLGLQMAKISFENLIQYRQEIGKDLDGASKLADYYIS